MNKMEALKTIKETLEDSFGNINPVRGYAEEIEEDIKKSLILIDKLIDLENGM